MPKKSNRWRRLKHIKEGQTKPTSQKKENKNPTGPNISILTTMYRNRSQNHLTRKITPKRLKSELYKERTPVSKSPPNCLVCIGEDRIMMLYETLNDFDSTIIYCDTIIQGNWVNSSIFFCNHSSRIMINLLLLQK